MKTTEFLDPRYADKGWRAHSAGLKLLLGIQPEHKLPQNGSTPKTVRAFARVDGKLTEEVVYVKVWVAPRTLKRKVHRVRAECPFCATEVSAGRLFQHRCN